MKSCFIFSLAAACGLFAAVAAGADTPAPAGDVAVYLSTDATKPALLHLSAGDASLADAQPVLDAARVIEGWRVAVLPGPFTGYVATKTTHKDLTVTPNTPVHVSPDENSPVLGPAPSNPFLTITSPGIDWSEVSFPGPLPVYFIAAAPKPATPAVAPTPAPTPAVIAPPTPPPTVTPVTAIPAVTAVTAVPAATQADPTEVGHYYYGVLKLRTDLNIGGPTNAHYVLYGPKGQIVALVDLNDVVLPNPVITYLNKAAKIYGTAYPEPSLPFAVIHAFTLQAN